MDGGASQDIQREEIDSVVIRFAGDSGDGMQLTGAQFTSRPWSAATSRPSRISRPRSGPRRLHLRRLRLPDPLRLPRHHDAGRRSDVLVAMNPAALKTSVGDLVSGSLLINEGAFTKASLKGGYENPR